MFIGCKKRKTAIKAVPLQFALGASAPRLNNRSLTFADRCFAFANATSKTKGENH
jgi:hypothetical protein